MAFNNKPLTEEEKNMIPKLIKVLLKTGPRKKIYSDQLIRGINERLVEFGLTNKFSGVRLRKVINFMRSEGILPVLSSRRGYYVSYDEEELLQNIKSLRERASSIIVAADGLEYILKQKRLEDNKTDDLGFTWND